ncbi:hypothetical protein ACWFRB_13750 [Rhodococcus sp. NPDC055112]
MGLSAACVSAGLIGAGGASAQPGFTLGCSTDSDHTVCSYESFGPAEYYLDVPLGVTSVSVTAKGGSGHGLQGGRGGTVTSDLPVTPGQRLFIMVGPGGGSGLNAGGGFAAVATQSAEGNWTAGMNSRLLVAPGGGGGGAGAGGNAGASAPGVGGGQAGSDLAGGAAGIAGTAGVLGSGGSGGLLGSGGGGGNFGGGGGAGGGGGSFLVPAGGSSGLAPAGSFPSVVIEFDSSYVLGTGSSGSGSAGSSGGSGSAGSSDSGSAGSSGGSGSAGSSGPAS